MQINKFGFIIIAIILTLIQQLINQNTSFYLDIIGVLPIGILLNIEYTLTTLTLVSLFADLVGHWYLGTHLFANLITSLFTNSVINFYQMCNTFQKIFLTSIFYLVTLLLVSLIGYLTHNIAVNFINFTINIIVVCPITTYFLNRYAYKLPPNVIRY